MRTLPLCALALLAACDAASPPTPPPAAPGPPAPVPAPTSVSPASIAENTALLDFAYEWPAEAATIPKLDARLRADARTSRQRALNTAREDREARAPEFPAMRHEFTGKWTVEGDAAGLLSLRDEFYVFTGGAHGMSGFQFILWDRAAGRDITTLSLFASQPRAGALLSEMFCETLGTMRAERRSGPVEPGGAFSDCPKLKDHVLLPSDTRAGAFTSLRVLVGHYEAGPYAEGTYDVRLNVTPELVALLKPERRAAFKVR